MVWSMQENDAGIRETWRTLQKQQKSGNRQNELSE